jgi:hypothetical protein
MGMIEVEIWLVPLILFSAGILGWAFRGISDVRSGLYVSRVRFDGMSDSYDEMSELAKVMAKKLDDAGIEVRYGDEF